MVGAYNGNPLVLLVFRFENESVVYDVLMRSEGIHVHQNYRRLSDLIICHLKDNGNDDTFSLPNTHARATVLSDTTLQARAYNQLRYHQIFK